MGQEGQEVNMVNTRTPTTYQDIIQQFTNMCILPAKVMVTVIQSARVFHGVVAMDQHVRGYTISVYACPFIGQKHSVLCGFTAKTKKLGFEQKTF